MKFLSDRCPVWSINSQQHLSEEEVLIALGETNQNGLKPYLMRSMTLHVAFYCNPTFTSAHDTLQEARYGSNETR